ncbi:MAG TPA: hypothetical protein VE978_24500 [Chitinophagales bacterium]|nr:hypothetical protein [Chitinophagales bacterium]
MKKLIITILLLTCVSVLSHAQAKQKPIATYKIGAAKVTVWEDTVRGKNGTFTVKNFKVEKVYKKDSKWQTTNNFSEKELLELKAAIDKAIVEQGVKEEK